jgi:hypothetical protein
VNKPKMVAIYLQLLMSALRPPRPKSDSLNHVTRGHQGRSSMMIWRSTLSIVGIIKTIEIVENRQQQPAEQKEKMSFHRSDDAEKWCEIHHTA